MKNKVLFLVSVLIVSNATTHAQTVFSGQNIIIASDVATANYVFPADLDGDGDFDVISASSGDNKIAWYENMDGNGNFSVQKVISTNAEGANSVYSADIDGDGDQDVLSSSGKDKKIAWYKNDGNGNFSDQIIITLDAVGARSVCTADLDGDGDQDVLAACGAFTGSKITWYENTDGSGTFSGENVISTKVISANCVYASDLDNDGDMDVLSSSFENNKIAWYKNDGNGNFSDQIIITLDAVGARSVCTADIDVDGDMDVLSASLVDSKIAWYENTDGNGTFSEQKVISTSAVYANAVSSADINGDGFSDVLSASMFDDKIAWYRNLGGTGDFFEQQIITTEADWAISVSAADLDGDGDQDVLSASMMDDKIAWYQNTNGSGDFSEQILLTKNLANGASSVYAADIDGDGDRDVLSASQNDNKVAWYENIDGNGSFSEQNVITTEAKGACCVYATDIDGDGDMDVLSASSAEWAGPDILWYENTDGYGNFSGPLVITNNAIWASSVYAADLDSDGDMDVLSASRIFNLVAWYENTDGAGSWSEQKILADDANSASSVYAADIDGDGNMDVLSASEGDDIIAWYRNTDGLGDFSEKLIITEEAEYATSVFAADIDGDGDMDVLSSSSDDDKIAWYENTDGAGSFSDPIIIDTLAEQAKSVHAADMDGDGDMDVLAASHFDNIIAWYENTDGMGNFSDKIIISENAERAMDVFAADIDNDGDQDVLSASNGDNKIAWYENLGGVGIDELQNNAFLIYPNPTSGIVYFQFEKSSIKRLRIIDMQGRIKIECIMHDKAMLDLSGLEKGVYMVNVLSGKKVYTARILKE